MSDNDHSRKNDRNMAVFESAPIPVAVMTLAVPTIITQLINIVYNFADTWYVGRTGSAAMVAALSVSMPVFVLMAAIANLFGIGGASVISRALGRKDIRYAKKNLFLLLLWGDRLLCPVRTADRSLPKPADPCHRRRSGFRPVYL